MTLKFFLNLEKPIEFSFEEQIVYNNIIKTLKTINTTKNIILTINKINIFFKKEHIRFIQLSSNNRIQEKESLSKIMLIFDKQKLILSIKQSNISLINELIPILNNKNLISNFLCIETITDTIYVNLLYLQGIIILEK